MSLLSVVARSARIKTLLELSVYSIYSSMIDIDYISCSRQDYPVRIPCSDTVQSAVQTAQCRSLGFGDWRLHNEFRCILSVRDSVQCDIVYSF